MRRANDPQRREKIIRATLEAVKLYGIHAVTHRKIATLAGVPLGSMTYYFSGIDELLLEAFSRFTEIMSRQYQAFLAMLVMLGRMPGYHRYDLQLTGRNAG